VVKKKEVHRYMNLIITSIAVLLSMQLTGCGHIEANVPEQKNFRTYLTRDLNSYFASASSQPVSVEYDLLRDYPTQTGIAYPKYYA
jgi:hypothetical protein